MRLPDWLLPTLQDVEGHEDRYRAKVEARLARATMHVRGSEEKASRYADDELGELDRAKSRISEATAALRWYSVRAAAHILGAFAVVWLPSKIPVWKEAVAWGWGFEVALLLAALYIAANAAWAERSCLLGLAVRSFPGDPALLPREGALHYVQLAEARGRLAIEWNLIANDIVSRKLIVQHALGNVWRGYAVVLGLYLLATALHMAPVLGNVASWTRGPRPAPATLVDTAVDND